MEKHSVEELYLGRLPSWLIKKYTNSKSTTKKVLYGVANFIWANPFYLILLAGEYLIHDISKAVFEELEKGL